MPSLKSHIIRWVVWYRFKANWSSAEAMRERIDANRKESDYRPSEKFTSKFVVEEDHRPGLPVYHVKPKGDKPTEARILYNHGGGFVFEITPEHWYLIGTMARRLNAVVTVPIYPLGPETPLLKMYDVVQPLYNEMAAAKDTTPFWVMGDSAGGTMTVVMTQQALKAGLPTASRIVPITPCMDSSLANPDLHTVAARDPWLGVPGIQEVTRLICPDVDTKDPRVSPIYGDFSAMPPMLIFGASEDMLGPDAKKTAEMAKEKGREVEYVHGEGMVHVWPLLPIWEAKVAVDKIVEWLEAAKK